MGEILKTPENLNEGEGKLKKFIYRDNKEYPGRIIFECVADDILNADKQYETATGNNPEKQTHIGCEIISIEDNENQLNE